MGKNDQLLYTQKNYHLNTRVKPRYFQTRNLFHTVSKEFTKTGSQKRR